MADAVTRRPGRPQLGPEPRAKVTISVDTELYDTIQANVGPDKRFGSFSQAVGEALTDMVRRLRLSR